LRPHAEDCVVRLEHDGVGLVPRVVALTDVVLEPGTSVFGPFRSERDAWRAVEGKAREAGLCLKTLGLEAGEGSCFAYQLKKCRGACLGREPRALHDTRLQLTLASLKLKPWPFPGPIGLREPTPGGQGVQIHVLDRWRHLGTARDAGEVAEVLQRASAADACFDADGYRIIGRALAEARPRDLMLLNPSTERP
jgi:DNA polymerase-3 subunit epsilon